jgi:Rrf2 family iron-sulfur cluster assembly transcriptional regulator
MRVNTKGRFAVVAMLDLALHCGSRPVTLIAISSRQGISLSYLEQLFSKLRRHHIVESLRGPGGGYRLCRLLEEISVADIVAAVDDALFESDLAVMSEASRESASRIDTEPLWASLSSKVTEYLASISLRALVDEKLAAGVSIEDPPLRKAIYPRAAAPARSRAPNSVFALADVLSGAQPARP